MLVMRVGHLAVTFVEGKRKNGCTPNNNLVASRLIILSDKITPCDIQGNVFVGPDEQ